MVEVVAASINGQSITEYPVLNASDPIDKFPLLRDAV